VGFRPNEFSAKCVSTKQAFGQASFGQTRLARYIQKIVTISSIYFNWWDIERPILKWPKKMFFRIWPNMQMAESQWAECSNDRIQSTTRVLVSVHLL
jgi:hypothetical protein